MKKKLQIFISSTFEDLKKERQLVIEAILEMGYLPAGMEYFTSNDAQQFEIIKRWIKESDAYLLIIGGRYGSINQFDLQGRSYTHMEYEYAKNIKKPIRIIRLTKRFLEDKKAEGIYTESDLNNPKLIEFRNNLPLCNNVSSVNDVKSVAKTLLGTLKNLEGRNNCGWIKSADMAPLIQLHPNNVSLARSKQIKGIYNIYYYSLPHKRYIYSSVSLKIINDALIATLKNDIDEYGRPLYTYSGKYEMFDDFLYIELKSDTDNEKLFLMIKLLPGRLNISMGIMVGQGASKQAVATVFIISKKKIERQSILDEFRKYHIAQFNNSERLVIDDASIRFLSKSIAERKD